MTEKKRKHATEMTSEEIAKHVFGPNLHAELKKFAQESGEKKSGSRRSQTKSKES